MSSASVKKTKNDKAKNEAAVVEDASEDKGVREMKPCPKLHVIDKVKDGKEFGRYTHPVDVDWPSERMPDVRLFRPLKDDKFDGASNYLNSLQAYCEVVLMRLPEMFATLEKSEKGERWALLGKLLDPDKRKRIVQRELASSDAKQIVTDNPSLLADMVNINAMSDDAKAELAKVLATLNAALAKPVTE